MGVPTDTEEQLEAIGGAVPHERPVARMGSVVLTNARVYGIFDEGIFGRQEKRMTAFCSMRWLVLLGCLLLGIAQGQENPLGGGNPLAAKPAWAGTFADSQVKATFTPAGQGFNGTITVGGATHPARGTVAPSGELAGTFTVGQRSFDMTAVMDGDMLVLTSGGTTYRLARQEEQNRDRRGPDLSHVRVGQKYHYTMTNAGAAPMTMIYEVKEVRDNLVNYTTQMIMDMGQGPQPVGEPNPMEWRHVEAPATTTAPPASGPRVELTRATVAVSGIEFECLVIVSGNTKTWVPVTGDIATFPGLIKTQTDGRVTMELTQIEGGGAGNATQSGGTTRAVLFSAGTVRAAAVLNMIASAEDVFRRENTVYTDDLAALASRRLIPEELRAGLWFGYRYEVSATDTSYTIMARPASAQAGTFRFMLKSGEAAVRINATNFRTSRTEVTCDIYARDPNDTDRSIRAYSFTVPVTATWSNTQVNVADGDAVLLAADGRWQVGPTWQPNGPDGSDEKSGWADFREVKADNAKVGGFTAKIEGANVAYAIGSFGTFISDKAGSLFLGVNDRGAENNTGGPCSAWVVVIRP